MIDQQRVAVYIMSRVASVYVIDESPASRSG